MTRISVVDEEESFSDDSTTASCNTTDQIESAIEDENEEDLLRKFQEDQIQSENAQEFYNYCRYYQQFIIQAEDDDDDELEQVRVDNEEKERKGQNFRRQLAASVLTILLRLADTQIQRQTAGQASTDENLDLRPNLAILRHKPEVLSLQLETGSPAETDQINETPEWYFNMPDTLTPFPDFASRNATDN